MAFEDLTGGTGFTSDSEGATADLNINMTEESARNLWDVQAAIQQIAVDFQTAVRSAADFQSYLISIRETSQTVKMPSLGMEGGEGGNMTYAGGRVDTNSIPTVQSEIGMASRISEMQENSTGAGGGAIAAHAPGGERQPDAGVFINQMSNAGWMASMTGQHASSQATSDAYQAAYQYAQSNPRDPQVLGATYGSSRGTPHAFAASQLIGQGLPAAQQFLRGGGVGGAAAMFGRLGTVGALGYAAYQLADAGLETYAQSRAFSIGANNSALGTGWGFGQRVSQAGMALSPFVSQEEAAQIYSAAVSQGWASNSGGFQQGTFGQALDFMYGAAKDYNMDPGMSSQLLQTNALGAGQSIQALAGQLLTLKQTLDGTGVSTDAANASFASLSSTMISAGADPGLAASYSGGIVSAFAGNTYLQNGLGAQTVMDLMKSKQTQGVLAGLTGTMPGAVFSGRNSEKSVAELDKLNNRLASQAIRFSDDVEKQASMFALSYNAVHGTNIDQQTAKSLMLEYASNPKYLETGRQEYEAKVSISQETRSGFESWWNGLDNLDAWAITPHGAINDLSMQENNTSLINSYRNYSPEVNTLLSNSGDLTKVVLYGPDGKPVTDGSGNRVAGANIAAWFNDTNNYSKFSAKDSGYYIQDETGAKHNAQNIGMGGSGIATSGGSASEGNTVYITLSPEAKRWFDTNTNQLDLSDGKN